MKVLRALVKETLSREQVDRLADDIHQACATLEKKGGAHPAERQQMKRSPASRTGRRAVGRGAPATATRRARRAGR